MKKIIFWTLFYYIFFVIGKLNVLAAGEIVKPNSKSIINVWPKYEWTDTIDAVLGKIRDWMFIFLPVCAIWAIVYAWYLLITWYWDETKFKQAWHILAYTLIWVALVVFAYMIVKIVRDVSL